MTARSHVLSLSLQARSALVLFIKDIGQGLLVVSHNTLALLGFAVLAVGIVFASQADLRQDTESKVLGWLNARHEARVEASGDVLALMVEPDAISRATAVDPKQLNREQAAVAQYLARRYRVAPEPVSRLVKEAYDVGQRARVDPTLILSIMAIESGFNPFAQSSVGAQGLMQVLTRVHDDKYEAFGGNLAAFDPITNLRVGVQVLKECIQRAGSVEEGLRRYVGAANLPDDAGYAVRVLAEQDLLKMVVAGRNVSPNAARPAREPSSAPAPSTPTGEQVAMVSHTPN